MMTEKVSWNKFMRILCVSIGVVVAFVGLISSAFFIFGLEKDFDYLAKGIVFIIVGVILFWIGVKRKINGGK